MFGENLNVLGRHCIVDLKNLAMRIGRVVYHDFFFLN